MPKKLEISIKDLVPKTKMFTQTQPKILGEGIDKNSKLNTISMAINEMAKSYSAAASVIEDTVNAKKENKKMFLEEVQNSLETIKENILYEDLVNFNNGIMGDLFNILLEKEELERKDILETFAKHNRYIIEVNETQNRQIENSIFQALKNINYTYKISKINFVWEQKEKAQKQEMQNKLSKISKAIEDVAKDIEKPKENLDKEILAIRNLFNQKQIEIQNIECIKQKNGKNSIKLCTSLLDNKQIMIAETIFSRVFLDNVKYIGKENSTYYFESKDKYKLEIGVAKTNKHESKVSGDSTIQTKLKDGKYLLAISDGMGSGCVAKETSKRVINLLERLLSSGFDSESSIDLINSAISSENSSDMYATIDAGIFDLYKGNVQFIKNGATVTYIKTQNKIKEITECEMPVGITSHISIASYDKDLAENDLIVMCSDGIKESKEGNWLKELLEKIEIQNVQKIADIILQEAIDNNYGQPKDDMTIIVAKVK